MLNETIANMNASIEKKDNENQRLILEIERLKNNNDKNSSNSGKPTSKDGFKKIIHNSREKSSKKPGGQNGHKGCTADVSKKLNKNH